MRTYIYGFLAVLILAIGNWLGQQWDLFESVRSYDIFMHLFGGFALGMSIAAAVELHGGRIAWKRTLVIFGVLAAGILWELFEAHYNIAGAPVGTKAYWIDTIKDLIDDTAGGAFAAAIETTRLFRTRIGR